MHFITLLILCIEDFCLRMQYNMNNANNRTIREAAQVRAECVVYVCYFWFSILWSTNFCIWKHPSYLLSVILSLNSSLSSLIVFSVHSCLSTFSYLWNFHVSGLNCSTQWSITTSSRKECPFSSCVCFLLRPSTVFTTSLLFFFKSYSDYIFILLCITAASALVIHYLSN